MPIFGQPQHLYAKAIVIKNTAKIDIYFVMTKLAVFHPPKTADAHMPNTLGMRDAGDKLINVNKS